MATGMATGTAMDTHKGSNSRSASDALGVFISAQIWSPVPSEVLHQSHGIPRDHVRSRIIPLRDLSGPQFSSRFDPNAHEEERKSERLLRIAAVK